MTTLTVAVLQAAFGEDMQTNIERIIDLTRAAATDGARVVLPPELFQGPYFPKTQDERWFASAYSVDEHPCVQALVPVAQDLGVVIPVSIFEKDGPCYYNSVVVLDADGSVLGTYRKSHIPDGPGYQEKFYFRPGDTGFQVWRTQVGVIGVGICWDQWFPETARAFVQSGADLLLYPTAIGSEPQDSTLDTSGPWRRVMQGHAVANVVPIAAANRVGNESGQVFYGASFMCDETGAIAAELGREEEGVAIATFDMDAITQARAAWGFFRDRRPDLYVRE